MTYKKLISLQERLSKQQLTGGAGSETLKSNISSLTESTAQYYKEAVELSRVAAEKIKDNFNLALHHIDMDIIVSKQAIADKAMLTKLKETLRKEENQLSNYYRLMSENRLRIGERSSASLLYTKHQQTLNRAVKSGILTTDEARSSLDKYSSSFSRFATNVGGGTNRLSELWHRFGAIALGFTVFYRAMNAVEFVFRTLITEVAEGLKTFDSLQKLLLRLLCSFQYSNTI